MRKLCLKCLIFCFSILLVNNVTNAQVVISQVYGGGGNAGSTFKNDFIEIFNRGTSTVSLVGWSVQYAATTGTSWQKTDLTGSIAPGQYYLIQEAAGAGGTTNLPTADATGAINMAAGAGKVALLNVNTLITAGTSCPAGATVQDFVGFGTGTNCFEGSGPTATISALISAQRAGGGCTDNNNNSADFSTGAPNPRNTASSLNPCAAATISVAAGTNAAEPATNGTFTISFSTPTAASTDVNYAYTGGASFGTDYTVSYSAGSASTSTSTGTLTVPSGVSSITVTITPVDDPDVEGTENITLTLSAPTGGYTLSSPAASINLTDNDVAPTVSVAAGVNAAEPATNGSFTITFSTATTASTDITYNYTGGAGFGTDYTVSYSAGSASTSTATGVLTVPSGTSSVTVTITPVNDPDVEGSETITLTLSAPSGGYTLGTASASINITSDDVPPPAPISLTGSPYTQDFNTLSNTGTTNTLAIPGWLLNETGGGARDNELYAADNGGSTTGDAYSYGLAASTERAFGGLQSGTLIPTIGAFFINNTGGSVSRLKITYTGEQWRLGTINRTDQIDFQYSLDATGLATGNWVDIDQLDFISPFTATAGTLNGNTNSRLLSFTITGLSIPNGGIFYIRWSSFDASGADDGLAVDDFTIETDPVDVSGPAILALSPPNGAVNIQDGQTATVTFDENIQKGAGNIYVRRVSDNVAVQTIGVSTAAVTVTGNKASFDINGLFFSTTYYIEMDAGTFKDVLNNNFAGISGSATWSFTSVAAPPAGVIGNLYNFDICTAPFTNGFTQYSVVGAQKWECTTFGVDAAHSPTGSAANGVQVNGFSGTNVPNEDWFISPVFDLTGTTFPLLSFWSRNAFNGASLQLKVSTDYPGTGNPNNYTWTDLNGRFPAQASNVWTLSENINLTAFKTTHTYFAFVYFSSDDDGARWTLDDILVNNSAVPPPPSLTVSTTDMQFTYVASGSTADKTFSFTGNDLTNDVSLTATGAFQLSKDGITFSSSLLYTVAEANNVTETVYVRFAPTQTGQDYTGTVNVSTGSLSADVNLKGTSIDPATTLEVVNWNLEWFGSPVMAPNNDNQQEQNVKTILQSIQADIFGVVEVVDEARLANVVSQMPGYSYVIGNFGSHVNPPEPGGSPLGAAQKLAFVYKTALLSNISTRPLINSDMSSASYNNWSGGRFPFLMTADVTLNCVTKRINFVLIHGKANTSPTATAYARRQASAVELHDTLTTYFANENVIMLGDFNDDLDQSITAGFTITSYNSFTDDNANFFSPTLALSLAGKRSTVGFNDMIDHVMLSNDMQPYYMANTANVLTDVSSLVTNYGTTTTDHFPVFTRYRFEQPAPPLISCPGNVETNNDAGVCGATVNYSVTYEGGCGTVLLQQTLGLPSGSVFPIGVTTNTYVVTDAAGGTTNCSFTVTVHDTENPTISCPGNITQNADAGTCGATVTYSVSFGDNCSGATAQQTEGLPSGAIFPAGATTNTFVVTDASGNTATCSFTVTVHDAQNPIITCPGNMLVNTAPGTCSATVNYVVTSSDNCSGSILQQTAGLPSGATFPKGVTNNIFVVTDASGNTATCSFTVTVEDHEAPTFTRPSDITIPFTTTCTYNAGTAVTGDVTNEHDNCATGIQATYTDVTTVCGNTVVIARTWLLTDGNGNTAADQVQTITVSDNNTSYIVYATKEAKFGEENFINGSVGVTASNGEAEFKNGTVLPAPYFARAHTVDVKPGATVPNRINTPANNGPNPPFYAYAGSTSGLPDLTLNSSPGGPVAGNYRKLKIKKNVTVTLTGSLYGEISIEEGTHVTFNPAGEIINIGEIKVDGKNNVVSEVKFTHCTSVRVKDKVVFDQNVQVNTNGPKVTFYLGDSNADEEKFKVTGGYNTVTVNVFIPNGKLKVSGENNKMTTLNGWFIAEKVQSDGKDVTWNSNNNCSSAARGPITSVEEPVIKPGQVQLADMLTVKANPNPSSDRFRLSIESNRSELVTIRISDLSGRVVRVYTSVVPNSPVDLGQELKSGVYFAEITQGKEKRVVKLVKL